MREHTNISETSFEEIFEQGFSDLGLINCKVELSAEGCERSLMTFSQSIYINTTKNFQPRTLFSLFRGGGGKKLN